MGACCHPKWLVASAVTTPPPTSCCSHGLSVYFLLLALAKQPHPSLKRTWKAVIPNVSCKPSCQQHVNVLEMLQMLPALLNCLLPTKRGRGAARATVPRVCVQAEISKTRDNECLFKIPFHLISTDASEITFFAGLLSNEKIFGSS